MVALIMTVLLGVTAFAVDIGHQRVERRDAQAIADLVALDMARHLDGTKHNVLKNRDVWRSSIAESIARNTNVTPVPAIPKPSPGDVVTVHFAPLTVHVSDGILDSTGGFTPATGNLVPNAVKVTVESSVDYAFVPGVGDVARSAIASPESNACFRVGSSTLNLDTKASPLLSGLLNDALSLNVATYQGLAGADLSLLEIATELGVGSVDELVALNSLTIADVFVASATVLRKRGDTANADLLDQIALNVSTVAISINDLVDLSTAGESALGTHLNALDLVQSGVFLANGTNALSIPDLQAKLPIVNTNLDSSLTVIEKPRRACGIPGTAAASTSQVALDLGGDLAALTVPLGALGDLTATVRIDLDFDLASARALLSSVTCESPEQWDIGVRTELASFLKLNARIELTGDLTLIGLASVEFPTATPVSVNVALSTNQGAIGQHVTWKMPPDTHADKKSTGSGVLLGAFAPALPPLSGNVIYDSLLSSPQTVPMDSGLLGVVNAALTPALNLAVLPLLATVVAQLNTNVLAPLTAALGVRLAGADVWVEPNPRCDELALRG